MQIEISRIYRPEQNHVAAVGRLNVQLGRWRGFIRPYVAAVSAAGIRNRDQVPRARNASLVRRESEVLALIDRRTARQQRHRERRTAVVPQGTKQRILPDDDVRRRAADVCAARILEEVVIVRVDRAVHIGGGPGRVRGKDRAAHVGISVQTAANIRLIARNRAIGNSQRPYIINAAARVEAAAADGVVRDGARVQGEVRAIVDGSAVTAPGAAPAAPSHSAAAADGRAEHRHTALVVQTRAVTLSSTAGRPAVGGNSPCATHGRTARQTARRDLVRAAQAKNSAAQTVACLARVGVHRAAALSARGAVAVE